MIPIVIRSLLVLESIWAATLLLLLMAGMSLRVLRSRRVRATAELRETIYQALAIYVGGNPETGRLRKLAAAHRDTFDEALQQFQGALAGRCEALGEVALKLGLVSRWCDVAQSGKVADRRAAFSRIASVAHYPAIHSLARSVASAAIVDSDEEIRVAAARVLLHSGDYLQIAQVFRGLLSDTPLVRILIGPELRPYATDLCRIVVPEILRNGDPVEIGRTLEILASWERGIPLPGLASLSKHDDPAVRLRFMRLLPLLPFGFDSRQTLTRGLADGDSRVREAAAMARERLGVSIADPPEDLACAGGVA